MLALQALFYMDAIEDFSKERIELFTESVPPPEDAAGFFHRLTEGVSTYRSEIDLEISRHAKNWKLERMLGVDRNLLRIATFEIRYCEDIPKNVAMNEAVELAKMFGGVDSPRFINGILHQITNSVEVIDTERE